MEKSAKCLIFLVDDLLVRDHSFSTYGKFFEKLAYEGVKNVSFWENLSYMLNK